MWRPAPDFCIIVQFTIYLNGFFYCYSFLIDSSTINSSHCETLTGSYSSCCSIVSAIYLTVFYTSSGANITSTIFAFFAAGANSDSLLLYNILYIMHSLASKRHHVSFEFIPHNRRFTACCFKYYTIEVNKKE